MKVIPIDALLDDDGHPNCNAPCWQVLVDGEVIFAVDRSAGKKFLVFGSDNLKEVLAGSTRRLLNIVQVEIDYESADLGKLLCVVEQIKGHHDFISH